MLCSFCELCLLIVAIRRTGKDVILAVFPDLCGSEGLVSSHAALRGGHALINNTALNIGGCNDSCNNNIILELCILRGSRIAFCLKLCLLRDSCIIFRIELCLLRESCMFICL